jgi:hypothetical protein
LKNIVRLPKEEAFALASKMAVQNAGSTAFWRFADFENYYSLRMRLDKYLYKAFISLGGQPKEEHPLSFVLQGSDYLDHWFDQGRITKIPLRNISSEHISFTYGDSGAALDRGEKINVISKDMLINSINDYPGTIDEYVEEITKKSHYIEVQLWNDEYIKSNISYENI